MKQCLLIVAGLLAVVGCQRRTFEDIDPDGGSCAVRFQVASVTIVPESKADAVTSTLPQGATVSVLAFQRKVEAAADLANDTCKAFCTYVVQSDGSLLPASVDDAGKPDGRTAPKAMELHGGKYDFYAFSPARKLEADNRTVKGIGHYQDFMGAYLGSQNVSRSNSTVALNFEHKSAKVTFSVKLLAGMICDSLFADSVVLHSVGVPVAPAIGGYTIGGDIVPTLGTVNDSCVLRQFSYLNASKKEEGATGYEITLPKSNGAIPAEFYVKVNKTPYVMKATLPAMAFQKGHNYMFTARVNKGEVQLTLKVASWNTVAQNNPDMGGDNGEILIGSWGNVDWGGGMGGNPDQVTTPIVIGSWTAVSLPADFIDGQTGNVGNWGNIGQDNSQMGKE